MGMGRMGTAEFLVSCATAVLLTSTGARAQVSEPSPQASEKAAAPSSAASTELGDIVVTANRRAENLQNVPVSITSFDAQAARALGVTTVRELAQQTPGLNVVSIYGNAQPNIFIRGVGLNDFNASSSGAVGVYVDDVFIESGSGQLFQMFDLNRIEVLRGPQGTLYGRNTTGGAIKVTTQRPKDRFEGYLTAEYGRFNRVGLEGAVNFPLAPGLAFLRVSGVLNRRDGVTRNDFTGTPAAGTTFYPRVNNINDWAGRALLLVTPTNDIDILLNVNGGQNRSLAYNFQHRGLIDLAGGGVPCSDVQLRRPGVCTDYLGYADTDGDPFRGSYNRTGPERIDVYGGSLNIDWRLGWATLTSLTAYQNVKRLTVEDTDASPVNTVFGDAAPRSWQVSQEVRLASPGEKRLNWILGGFYSKYILNFSGFFDVLSDLRPAISAAAAARGVSDLFPNGFNPNGSADLAAQLGDPVFAFPVFRGDYAYRQRVETYAAFGQADFALTNRLRLTAGLRYTQEKRGIGYASYLNEASSGFVVPTVSSGPIGVPLSSNATITPVESAVKVDRLSWRLALDYRIAPEVLLFGSYNRGFKSGGYNAALVFDRCQLGDLETAAACAADGRVRAYRPETLDAFELGIKADFLDRRARLNITVFYYDYKGLQVFDLLDIGGLPQQLIRNRDARVYGAEAELTVKPMGGLQLSGGASLLRTRIKQEGAGPDVLGGNELAQAPRFTANGVASYEWALGSELRAGLQADVSYTDGYFTDAMNTRRLRADARALVGARAVLQGPDRRWEFAAFGRNIFNERYVTNGSNLQSFGLDVLKVGDPATYGLQGTVRF